MSYSRRSVLLRRKVDQMTTTLGDSKKVLMQRALEGLATHIEESTLTTRQKVALT